MPFLCLYVATGEERTALIAIAANNAGRGINTATAYEYQALAGPAFDYEAEKSLIDQAYWWYPYPLEFRNSPHRKWLIREMGPPEYLSLIHI